ncbi:hypothetical protein [Methyloversatilis universalis]|uniref:hypothetical protein n=1 Tax=Methyloversatilis universalis TaxID=378211 RepID=UPI00037C809C|nr:hypothetical protein [Methyloversatilis universalis]
MKPLNAPARTAGRSASASRTLLSVLTSMAAAWLLVSLPDLTAPRDAASTGPTPAAAPAQPSPHPL